MAEIVIENPLTGNTLTEDAPTDQVLEESSAGVVDATRGERGMTTAEYAVGIVAACTLAGVLILVLKEPAFQKLMAELITNVLKHFIKP